MCFFVDSNKLKCYNIALFKQDTFMTYSEELYQHILNNRLISNNGEHIIELSIDIVKSIGLDSEDFYVKDFCNRHIVLNSRKDYRLCATLNFGSPVLYIRFDYQLYGLSEESLLQKKQSIYKTLKSFSHYLSNFESRMDEHEWIIEFTDPNSLTKNFFLQEVKKKPFHYYIEEKDHDSPFKLHCSFIQNYEVLKIGSRGSPEYFYTQLYVKRRFGHELHIEDFDYIVSNHPSNFAYGHWIEELLDVLEGKDKYIHVLNSMEFDENNRLTHFSKLNIEKIKKSKGTQPYELI